MNGRKTGSDDPSPYRFARLDPGDADGSGGANRGLLGRRTLGIEVTVPALAAGCGLGNIDPQHQPGGGDKAAIEVALEWPLPAPGSTLVTIRPDLDSLGAMAVLAMRVAGEPIGAATRARIGEIAQADRHDRGPWPGPRPIAAALAEPAPLAPLALAVIDTRPSLGERVAMLRRWLTDGEMPALCHDKAAAGWHDVAQAMRTGAVRARPLCRGRIAVVVGDRPEALRLGYCIAPVAIALNRAFRMQDGPPHRKFTVAQYRDGYADFGALLALLRAREPGWGGSPTIIGSPQGVASRLSLCVVARAVRQALAG